MHVGDSRAQLINRDDGDVQRRAPFAAVRCGGADEVTPTGIQRASDRFAVGHRQLAASHLAPGTTVVLAARDECFRFVTVAREIRDLLAVQDDGGFAPHLEALGLRDGHHIPLGVLAALIVAERCVEPPLVKAKCHQLRLVHRSPAVGVFLETPLANQFAGGRMRQRLSVRAFNQQSTSCSGFVDDLHA